MGEAGDAGEGDVRVAENASGHVDIAGTDDDGAEAVRKGFAAGGVDFLLVQIGAGEGEFEAAGHVFISN